jgi:hypothetical protein
MEQVIQSAIDIKRCSRYNWSCVLLEKESQRLISAWDSLALCQLGARQSIAVHQLPYDYYSIAEVSDDGTLTIIKDGIEV